MWYTIMVTAWIGESHLLKWQKSSIAQNYIELPHFIMRHRQAVRQRTLTPPSQVRLLLAQLKTPRMDAGKIQCSCGASYFYECFADACSGTKLPAFALKKSAKSRRFQHKKPLCHTGQVEHRGFVWIGCSAFG